MIVKYQIDIELLQKQRNSATELQELIQVIDPLDRGGSGPKDPLKEKLQANNNMISTLESQRNYFRDRLSEVLDFNLCWTFV